MKSPTPIVALAASLALAPGGALACACGCGVFDIGGASMTPTGGQHGLNVWFRYDLIEQSGNWAGAKAAPAADNDDKRLNSQFYTFGVKYMVSRDWMVMADAPLVQRAFTREDEDGSAVGTPGAVFTAHDFALGDLQLSAMYTGLSPDMSTGVGFGIKLPTGDAVGPRGPAGGFEFDRDTLPGTGSTDLMISGYHTGSFDRAGRFSYFIQGKYQFAVASRGGYLPGNELNVAAGIAYDAGAFGPISKLSPVLQLIDSDRARDGGVNADPGNTGYQRLLIAPGLDLRVRQAHLYLSVAVPLYQHANAAPESVGEPPKGQLVAPLLYTMRMSYDF